MGDWGCGLKEGSEEGGAQGRSSAMGWREEGRRFARREEGAPGSPVGFLAYPKALSSPKCRRL